ncbi:hypothetical protein PHSY_006481 [Pseudozyma hubeiensis SY62]|uniref:Uncharacterized protein n=1 Tax=Pseudozyma hubeiensis (strain SY62) TaxID=1305764 RepID=R9PBZ5_PSEHS|nr:hypothetical protein PHSY_006481 [Pseudozyma hubeiensis SY62]GAC98886.1 hypothetical protein PHSY_006481 [Pseudozyma hubeiensis SY62]
MQRIKLDQASSDLPKRTSNKIGRVRTATTVSSFHAMHQCRDSLFLYAEMWPNVELLRDAPAEYTVLLDSSRCRLDGRGQRTSFAAVGKCRS